jgi:mitochondrial inner membrane protease subunit 2
VERRKVAFAAVVIAGIAAAYGFRRWRPSRIEVEGGSMRPTLEPGDWAIAFRARRLHRGDVVVVEHPDRVGFELIKRVTHLPGDVAPDGLGLVDRLWVEGDDPEGSSDSRSFGPLPMGLVRGRVWLVWWPPGRIRAFGTRVRRLRHFPSDR